LGLVIVLNMILLAVVGAYYNLLDNRIATATSANDSQIPLLQPRDPVSVVYAASLLKTFEESLGPAFQADTGYPYQGEARGSVQIANMILDGLRRPDVFVSAGTIPVMKLMNATDPLADWLVKFGAAEMVIAYSPDSRFFNDLEKAHTGEIPWYEVLSNPELKFGRTDPELDPKGYYMIIAAELANKYYNDPGIKERILGEDRNPRQIFPEETLKTILEQGQLDAVAAYKHEAVARGLPYITLPPEINLADPTFSNFYKTASYTLEDGKGQTVFGEPIYFSFTIPTTVKNLDGAISFGTFILSPNGESILEEQGLNFINPVAEGNMEKVPSVIRDVLEQKEKEWMQQLINSVEENKTRSQLKGIGYITSKVCDKE
jgi:molybdate/tungstate transport system substrate-binding protein